MNRPVHIVPAFAAILALISITGAQENQGNLIQGVVRDGSSPIDSARVRIQGSSAFVFSDSTGRFSLTTGIDSGSFVAISAGKRGWYNTDRNARVGDTILTINLDSLPPGDDPDYVFQSPAYCRTCHEPFYEQWSQAKHSGAARNPMLLEMYNGTDTQGNSGVAPGFKLDFPFSGGDCADCHAPTGALFSPGDMDMNDILALGRVDTNGVYCDFCHKVWDVPVNYATGVNGAIFLKRPPSTANRDINLGPLDDVTSFWMGGTYNDVFQKSDFCSGCHQYKNVNGLIVDDTYDSWRQSSYAQSGLQCQDCHMKPFTDSIFVSGIGFADAVRRDPERLFNHLFRRTGLVDSSETAVLHIRSELDGDSLSLETAVTNRHAGHNLPTGVTFRNILLVILIDNGGVRPEQRSGDRLPEFAGVGPVEEGNYIGLPGKAFALVAADSGGVWPAPNWLATSILHDSRIPPDGTDNGRFVFSVDPTKPISITATLFYRAVFKSWADAKGWDMREYAMADTQFTLTPATSVEEPPIPVSFALLQNYPNPFNPWTTILYELPERSRVTLTVYDMLGNRVRVLLDESRSHGRHSARFDATGLASGIYMYQLHARPGQDRRSSGFTATRRMLLLK
jgi:hypothetical protein